MVALSPNQQRVAEIARSIVQKNPVYLDTETTGLDKNAEIVEIAVVDDAGRDPDRPTGTAFTADPSRSDPLARHHGRNGGFSQELAGIMADGAWIIVG